MIGFELEPDKLAVATEDGMRLTIEAEDDGFDKLSALAHLLLSGACIAALKARSKESSVSPGEQQEVFAMRVKIPHLERELAITKSHAEQLQKLCEEQLKELEYRRKEMDHVAANDS